MFLGGDEFRRTQGGNNNAYCQDNETSWCDWTILGHHQEIHRFVRGMIAFRRNHPVLSSEDFYTEADIRWFSPEGTYPNWSDLEERQAACLILGHGEQDLLLLFNAGAEAVTFALPVPPKAGRWHLAVDTFGSFPQDLLEDGRELDLEDQRAYRAGPQSSVILINLPSRAEKGDGSDENT